MWVTPYDLATGPKTYVRHLPIFTGGYRLCSQLILNREEYVINVILLKIDQIDKELPEEDTEPEEIIEVIKLCKNGKSPGHDGFPPEFCKFFRAQLA